VSACMSTPNSIQLVPVVLMERGGGRLLEKKEEKKNGGRIKDRYPVSLYISRSLTI